MFFKHQTFKIKDSIMPNKNGTGPDGKGQKTGRGLGTCKPEKSTRRETGNKQSGSRGGGRGRGQGLGRNA